MKTPEEIAGQARLIAWDLHTSSRKKSHGRILIYQDPRLRITLNTFSESVEVHDPENGQVLWVNGGLETRVLKFQPGDWMDRVQELAGQAHEEQTGRHS